MEHITKLIAALLLCLAVAPASAFLLGHRPGGGAGGSAYSDLCSQSFIGGSCVYSYDLDQRRVSTSTTPFHLTRLSDSAAFAASYTGSTFVTNAAAVITFCLGNGGTTTSETYSTQYNDCVYDTVPDQTGSGCDLVSGGPSNLGTTHAPPVQIRTSDGLPAIIITTQSPYTSPQAKYLFKSGCTVLDGSVARTEVDLGNNAYFSGCCGQYGKIETNPPLGLTPAGAMWSVIWYHVGAAVHYGSDIEGGGSCTSGTPTSLTPVIDSVGLTTYSATAGGSNTYLNDTLLGAANCTPQSTIASQDGMVIGCSGDYTACGPMYFRGMTFLNIDVTLTSGLRTLIYTYLTTYP